ncbi:hypothetical protein D4764_03G0004140 [Takifugu flavidus]|uniref:Uncharacterized protein n=1 Tax=Takifugu flavidus TaxID=433684 RepID=A0A5C6N7Q2_9TELE|nr:hypothetical protein D4764_03G0004140 [Takifugu flavidus]
MKVQILLVVLGFVAGISAAPINDQELHIDADDAGEYLKQVLSVTDEDLEEAAEEAASELKKAGISEEDLEEAAEEAASELENASISEEDLEEAAEEAASVYQLS